MILSKKAIKYKYGIKYQFDVNFLIDSQKKTQTMTATKLEGESKKAELSKLNGWKEKSDPDGITKNFQFKNFNEAFSFMTQIALVAEKVFSRVI